MCISERLGHTTAHGGELGLGGGWGLRVIHSCGTEFGVVRWGEDRAPEYVEACAEGGDLDWLLKCGFGDAVGSGGLVCGVCGLLPLIPVPRHELSWGGIICVARRLARSWAC